MPAFLKRYKSNGRGAWKSDSPIKLGQLTEPIVFLNSVSVPVDGTADFENHVKPYHRTHAAVDEGSTVSDSGQNADAQAQTVFVIRDEGHRIEVKHFIVWGNKVYKIMSTQRLRGLVPFLEVSTISNGLADDAGNGFVLDPTVSTPQSEETRQEEATNDFWG